MQPPPPPAAITTTEACSVSWHLVWHSSLWKKTGNTSPRPYERLHNLKPQSYRKQVIIMDNNCFR